MHLADLYTGPGPLLLAALSELPAHATGVGFDVSPGALKVAEKNARRHGLDSRASFVEQDLSIPQRIELPESESDKDNGDRTPTFWDIVFANPPYIRSADMPGLMPDVRNFEPRLALDGGPDGLEPYRDIASAVRDGHLRTRWLFLEIGHDQASDITDIFDNPLMMDVVEVRKDLAGMDRCVVLKRNNKEK